MVKVLLLIFKYLLSSGRKVWINRHFRQNPARYGPSENLFCIAQWPIIPTFAPYS